MGDLGDYWRDVRDSFRKELVEKKRIQTQERVHFVCSQIAKRNLWYRVSSPRRGQIVVFVNGKRFDFFARTGKITGYQQRGFRAFLKIIDKESYKAQNAYNLHP